DVLSWLITILQFTRDLHIHPVIGGATIILGGISIGAALLLIFTASAGVGFVLGLIIAMILIVVQMIKPNPLQDWLGDTCYGAEEKSGGEKFKFKGLAEQLFALEALSKG
ncbi:hypothetical protein ACGYTZ_31920, partial [Burkholderia pseudomallei]